MTARDYPQPDSGDGARCNRDTKLAQKQHKCSNTIDGNHTQNIARQNAECLPVSNTSHCT